MIFGDLQSLHLDDITSFITFNRHRCVEVSSSRDDFSSRDEVGLCEQKRKYQKTIMHLFIPVSLAMFYPPRQLSRLDRKLSSAGQS